jgi:hypothetical protein
MEVSSNHNAVLVEVTLPGGLSESEELKLTVVEIYHKRMDPLPK